MENNLTPKQALEKLKENEINIYFHLPWDILKDYYDIIEQSLSELETLKKEHDINMCMIGGVHYDKNNLTPKQALNCLLATLKDVRRNPLAFLIEETNTTKYGKIVEKALDELEELKTMKASFENDANRLNEQCTNLHLKDKKQTEILEVLKNKEVDVAYLKYCIHYCEKEKEKINRAFVYYNETRPTHLKITETEFNLLKEWLK